MAYLAAWARMFAVESMFLTTVEGNSPFLEVVIAVI